MAHPLNGARLKVCRAEEHLQALKESIADYVASVPYELAAEDDGETVNLVLTLISHPDPTIGAVIGDCLHNLRSALDYLMWELAGTYVNRRLEPPPDGKDRVYFPI